MTISLSIRGYPLPDQYEGAHGRQGSRCQIIDANGSPLRAAGLSDVFEGDDLCVNITRSGKR
jgi:hypothetical protein